MERSLQIWKGVFDPITMIPTINDSRFIEPACTKLLPVKTIYSNEWFSVRNRGGFYTIEYNQPQVIIFPIVNNNSIVMVKVYRPIIADVTLELPAGGAHEKETPIRAAMREFKEETGIIINDESRFELVMPLIHSLRSPCFLFFYKVEISQAEYEARVRHDHEVAEVVCLTFSEIISMIKSGKIYLGLHVAIILRYLLNGQRLELV